MPAKKPIFKKYRFWFPIIVGVVGGLAVVSESLLGIELSPEVQSFIIGSTLTILAAVLGVDWSEKEK